jgi:hypothetical protein
VADANDIADELASQALKPEEVDTSVAKVKNRPLADLIAAQKHLAAQEASGADGNGFFGIRMRKARFNNRSNNE